VSHPRLSIIPAGAVTDRSLEPRDLQTLCLLGRHIDRAGWCMRSQVRMAEELACGRATLQRSLERLYEAGWVEKKRRDAHRPEDSQPSASYAYRVKLDRDDFALESITREPENDDEASHAEDAEPTGGVPTGGQGVPAQTGTGVPMHERARGAHAYAGTNNDPLERPLPERERDARARGSRKGKLLDEFRKRWPTAAVDDAQRTAYAIEALTEDEAKAALDGIEPFLAELKRLQKKHTPAGWRYLEEKRWTMLRASEAAAEGAAARPAIAIGSPEHQALETLHAVARTRMLVTGGSAFYRAAVTPQLLAFAQAPPRDDWLWIEDRQQLAAWQAFIARHVFVGRPPLLQQRGDKTGIFAPFAWPPRIDGSLSASPEEASTAGGDE
jgi:DNA-binding transcriptional ArsR family regulator